MRRRGHPSRPRAITCCFFASLKTLLISTKATCLTPKSTSRASFSLAGFQVTLIGRFCVTPEDQAKVDGIAGEIVRSTIATMYPNFARGGSAAGRVASMNDAKAGQKATDAKAQASGRAQYVPTKPESLIRDNVVYGGRKYEAKDLDLLVITGKGFIKGPNGARLVTWRKAS